MYVPFPLPFKSPRSKALDPRKTGCPLSLKLSIMSTATRSHFRFGLYVLSSAPCLLWSRPKKRHNLLRSCTETRRWSVLGLLKFTLSSSHHALDLDENLQCSESCEFFPLELHRLPVDSIHFSTLGWIHKTIDFLLPCAYGTFNDSSHAQYWIGEYMSFWFDSRTARLLNRVVLFQESSCQSSTENPWVSVCSLTNLLFHIEKLFHCSLWLILGCM